jgi:6-phosphogluconolactonase
MAGPEAGGSEGRPGESWVVSEHPTDEDVARFAAHHVREIAEQSVQRSGVFTFAVSGGRTPWVMFAHLADLDMPWANTRIFQVDERIAPADDPARNLHHLRAALDGAPAEIVAMPVDMPDVTMAAADYARRIPQNFDLIHLGLGPDGHTASLVPGDPILDVTDASVAVTRHPYQGLRRMSLTYPTLDSADAILWLVTGAEKASALAMLLDHDPAIPAGRVRGRRNLVVCDAAARSVGVDAP